MAQTKVKLISDGVIVQGNLHASHGITTAHIGEGSNLYYTDARVGSYLSSNGYATQSTIVAAITDSAPSTLDTLNELAAALGDDVNFSTTVTNSIATKLPLAGGTLTGSLTITGGTAYGLNITTSGTQDTININRAANNDNAITKYQTASADKWIVGLRNTGDDNFRFYSYGTSSDVLTIDQANGNATFAGTIASNNIAVTNSGNGELSVTRTSGATVKSIAQSARGQIGTSSNHELQLITNATSRLTISTSGNATFAGDVQLGGTTPTLNFYKTSHADILANIKVESDTGTGGKLTIQTKRNGNTALDALVIYENQNSTFAGNVGIGTASPSTFLQVSGQGNRAGGNIQMGLSSQGANKWSYLTGTHYNSTTEPEGFALIGGYSSINENKVVIGGDIWETNPATSIHFWTHSSSTHAQGGSQRMVINSGGDVLIGNTVVNPASGFSNQKGIGYNSATGQAQIASTSDVATLVLGRNNSTDGSLLEFRKESTIIGNFGSNTTGGQVLLDLKANQNFRIVTNNSEAMRINSSGNLGIGTTSPLVRLQLERTVSNATSRQAPVNLIYLTSDHPSLGYTGFGTAITHYSRTYQNGAKTEQSKIAFTQQGDSVSTAGSTIDFYTKTLSTGSAAPDLRMRINYNGNVGIGTSTPDDFDGESRNLVIRGGVNGSTPTIGMTIATDGNQASSGRCAIRFADGINGNERYRGAVEYNHNGDDMSFRTAGTQRLRILSGGTVYIGDVTTSYGYSAHHIAKSSPSGYSLIVRNSDTSTTNNTVMQLNRAETTATTGGYALIYRQGDPSSGTNRMIVFANGNIQNSNNSYGSLSDERKKENIVDATPKLDDLMKVKVRNFNLKGEETKQIGVVAQELEEIFPGMINESKDPDSKDETLYKGVKYSVFVPILIKAIQELKAEIETLKTQINN